jgi:putative PEP-CTERM system TPR-repeat lipoprotein
MYITTRITGGGAKKPGKPLICPLWGDVRGAGRRRNVGRRALAIAIAFLVLAVGPASAGSAESEKFYGDALARFERNDIQGAIIQLDNALQADPGMLAAHVLQGKARLKSGDYAGAEASFDRALRLGVDWPEVAVPLARAYVAQGKIDLLLERITPINLPRKDQIEILIMRGNALVDRDNEAGAMRALEAAQRLDPRSLPVRMALASALLRTGQLVNATTLIDETVKIAPADAAVWRFHGLLQQLKGDPQAALFDYRKAISIDGKDLNARVALAGILVDMGQLEEATEALDDLGRMAPREPRSGYLRAILAKRKGDEVRARAELANVVAVLDQLPREVLNRNTGLLLLAGLSHQALGNTDRAAQFLTLYLKASPKQIGARKILASIYIDGGDFGRALEVLEPVNSLAPNDPQVLTLMAAAQMGLRQYVEAAGLLEKALKAPDAALNARINLGVSLIASGQSDVGFKELQQAMVKDPSQVRSGLVMATLYLRQDDPKKALDVIDRIVKRSPNDIEALNLQGIAHVVSGDFVGGRAAYEKALSMSPKFYAARLNTVRLDLIEGKLDSARATLKALLASNPNDGDAMLEFARLEDQDGRPDEAIRWLERALTIRERRVAAGIYLSGLLIRYGDFKRAVSVAKDATSRTSNNLATGLALARAQLAASDKASARQTLAVMTPLAGFDPTSNLDIARLQAAADDRENAYHTLDKALQSAPDYLPALVLVTEMEIVDGRYAKAEQHARRITDRFPARGIGPHLMGDIAAARGQTAQAVASYRAALAKEKNDNTLIRLYAAMVNGGERAKAVALLEQRHRENPNDAFALRALADAQVGAGDLSAARDSYRRLLERNPNDVEVLNNVAQVALRQDDRAALEYAERAYKLASTRPAVLDTLGWILVRQGQLDRGTNLLREARLRDAADPEIRYHLAEALVLSGRPNEARVELKEGLKDGASFEGIREARALQQKLDGP